MICKVCLVEKQAADFYGADSTCKECVKTRVRARYTRLSKDPIWMVNERKRTRERNQRLNYKEKYRIKSEATKQKLRECSRRWIDSNPEKKRAHNKVNKALISGRLQKSPCVVCGERKVEAHHHDYSRPLDVTWLCRKHHAELHRKIC